MGRAESSEHLYLRRRLYDTARKLTGMLLSSRLKRSLVMRRGVTARLVVRHEASLGRSPTYMVLPKLMHDGPLVGTLVGTDVVEEAEVVVYGG